MEGSSWRATEEGGMSAGVKFSVKANFKGIADKLPAFGAKVLIPWAQEWSKFITLRAQEKAPFGPTMAPEDRVYKRGRRTGALKKSVREHPGGELRASIVPTPVEMRGARVIAGTSANTDYAMRMHEELVAKVVKGSSASKNKLKLGYTSAREPSTPEGGVGGKYIERPYRFHAKSI